MYTRFTTHIPRPCPHLFPPSSIRHPNMTTPLGPRTEDYVNLEPLDHPSFIWLRTEVSRRIAPTPVINDALLDAIATTPDPHAHLRMHFPSTHVSYAIDRHNSAFIDDAIALDLATDSLLVHIADPTRFLDPHGPFNHILQAALQAAETLFLPSCSYTMLPRSLCKTVFSLGAPRWDGSAFTIRLTRLPPHSPEPFAASVFLSRIPPPRRYTYDQASDMLAGLGAPSADALALQRLDLLFSSLRDLAELDPFDRDDALPVWRVKVRPRIPDGFPMIALSATTGAVVPGRDLVSKCMTLAARGAGAFSLRDARLTLVFRATKRDGSNGWTTDGNAPHIGIGALRYARVTSPMRRSDDLVNHLQFKAYFGGQGAGLFNKEELAVMGHAHILFERMSTRTSMLLRQYWTVRYHERFVGKGWGRLLGEIVSQDVNEYRRRVEDGTAVRGRVGADCILVQLYITGAVCGAVTRNRKNVIGPDVGVKVIAVNLEQLVLDIEIKKLKKLKKTELVG